MEVVVRLHCSVSLPDPQQSRVVSLSLDENATVGGLMQAMAQTYPQLFAAVEGKDAATGVDTGGVCLFSGPEQLADKAIAVADVMTWGRQLTIAKIRPIPGG